ncbi:hypothetical protein LCGC14_1911630 [marine sediment metagenome]|uniref:Uncharacterized protein n=1 Tax=marine sediment metagenome TaxID=412755 RepID=A0A0F9GGR6_9ZZZZ
MANRNKKPLEWIFQNVNTANATPANARIELGLKDDEVAEIHKVMSYIAPAPYAAGGADDSLVLAMSLSMDPDVILTPIAEDNQDDLEWFYTHRHETQIELTTDGAYGLKTDDSKSEDFNPPVLVGTDVGMVVLGDAALACQFWVRLYFTRRKANVMELNQVLLKRR